MMNRGPLFLLYLAIAPFIWLTGVFGDKMNTGDGCIGGCLAIIGGLIKAVLVLVLGYGLIIVLCAILMPESDGAMAGVAIAGVIHFILAMIAISKGV